MWLYKNHCRWQLISLKKKVSSFQDSVRCEYRLPDITKFIQEKKTIKKCVRDEAYTRNFQYNNLKCCILSYLNQMDWLDGLNGSRWWIFTNITIIMMLHNYSSKWNIENCDRAQSRCVCVCVRHIFSHYDQ